MFIIGGIVALYEKQKQCKTWDESFLYIRHSYNQELRYNSLGNSMFEVCYGFHPLMSIDLINQLKSLNEIEHEQQEVEKSHNAKDMDYAIDK